MGVPRLFSFLQPLGLTEILGCNDPSCSAHPKDLPVTIDGPALAYHVYYKLLSHVADNQNILDSVVSYGDITKGVLAYLNGLQDHGLKIDTIHFDGYLHQHKYETRKERCAASLRNLKIFHATNSKGFKATDSIAVNADMPHQSIFFQPHQQHSSRLRGLPPPPFLVPVALEAIMRSKFASFTCVVPGEADFFCALSARSKGALILTNDSDLLLYDLGSGGAVCFLKSIEATKSSEPNQGKACEALGSHVLRPQDIMRRFGLQSLGHLAFHLSQDSHISFNTAVRRAKEKPTSDAANWTQLYDGITNFQSSSSKQLDQLEGSEFYLDPRVSELVLCTSLYPKPKMGLIFLPLLLEDPHRTSAWAAAASIRLLAYQFLDIDSENSPFMVTENVGRASASVIEIVGVRNTQNSTDATMSRLVERVGEARKGCCGVEAEILSWRVFALTWTHTWLLDNNKKKPSRSDVTHVLCGSRGAQQSWSSIHLMAQVHGVLYSLSMLRQMLIYRKIVEKDVSSDALQTLADTLHGLPLLSELMMSNRETGQHMAKYPIGDVLKLFSQAIRKE